MRPGCNWNAVDRVLRVLHWFRWMWSMPLPLVTGRVLSNFMSCAASQVYLAARVWHSACWVLLLKLVGLPYSYYLAAAGCWPAFASRRGGHRCSLPCD